MVSKFKLDSTKKITAKEAITRTFEVAKNYAGELSVEVLSLDKIELDPENHREFLLTLDDAINGINQADPDYNRKKQDWISLESLAKSIKDDQLINPVYVYRFSNKCRLIAGERRTLASAIAGKKEIIARIANQRPLGTKLRILQWIENNERSDLKLAERVASLETIITEYQREHNVVKEKMTAKLLSDLTSMSMTQARRYILILQSNAEIKTAIQAGKLENIKLIELICTTKNSERQRELLNAAISGLSFEDILRLNKMWNVGEKNERKKIGRKKSNVNLGMVKPNIVKFLIDALLSSNVLDEKIINQINSLYNKSRWNDPNYAEKGFKKIILLLNKGVK
jgi:ParB family chromosome partitioning protein